MNLPTADLKISREQACDLIREARGMISVYAVKRGDGSMRRFNGFAACNLTDAEREKVTTGKGSNIDHKAHDLIPFYEMVSETVDGFRLVKGKTIPYKQRRTLGKQFRSISVEGIKVVRCNGQTFAVQD